MANELHHCRLNLLLSHRHVKAYVEDQKGNILVKASTAEFEIRQHLYKANDVSAATNIGRVIAERCICAGLNRVSMYTTDLRKKEKVLYQSICPIKPLVYCHFNILTFLV